MGGAVPPFRFLRGGRDKLNDLDRALHAFYGAPETLLGNQPDPLDEAIYIILSFQTDVRRIQETWRNLRSTFPTWNDLDDAPLDHVSVVLRTGGLHRQKARAIKRLLHAVRGRFGALSLDSLHQLPDDEAERELTRLPGLSWKGARCVLLYSLNRQVFPIDGNTFRVLKRTGVIPLGAVYRRIGLHDAIQGAVAPPVRRRFHVNLVVHGQDTCLPQRPRCGACPASNMCPMRRLPNPPTESIGSP